MNEVMNSTIQVHDEECEKYVLGTAMSNANALAEIREFINDDSFYISKHQAIWRAMVALEDKGIEPDIITVYGELQSQGMTEITPFELGQLGVNVVIGSAVPHALRLNELAIRRKMWMLGHKLVSAGSTEVEDVNDVREHIREYMDNMFTTTDDSVFTLEATSRMLYELVNKNMSGSEELTGTPTGFSKLDAKGGLHPSDLVIVAGESSQGKALLMDELILTAKNGWVKNKDLKIGDELASIDGEPSYVVGIYPQGVKPMYRMTFADGRTAVSSEDHLWEVGSSTFRLGNRILTTGQIKEMHDNHTAFHNHMYLPEFCGVYGEKKEFVIPPYILGVLIGDGCLTRGVVIANDDDFVYHKVKSLCELDVHKRDSESLKKRVDMISITAKSHSDVNVYREELKRLGLFNKVSHDKFIPKEYLECCYEQRLELLNGLLDTDGEATIFGQISFSTVSERLANDVSFLCHSLGFKCSKNRHKSEFRGKKYKDHFRLTVASTNRDEDMFTLPRKKERIKQRKKTHNTIRSIDFLGFEECQCIKVSHPRELFVMRDFIVTHNTSFSNSIVLNAIQKGAKVAFYSMEMTKVQLTARLAAMMSGVSSSDLLYSTSLTPDQLARFDGALGALSEYKLYFDDKSTSNIEGILASIRSLKMKYDIDGVVVDYLQILNVNSKNSNKEQAMADAARRLKNIAKDLNIWVIALSQLNRDSNNPQPNLNRLRDSGQIAEAADMVMFVYRPEYYGKSFPEPFESESTKGKAMIDVAKGRNIGTMRFLTRFHAPLTLFEDIREGETINPPSDMPF